MKIILSIWNGEEPKIITAAHGYRNKVLVACYYDSGARRNELLSVNIGGVTFDEYGCRIYIRESKTQPRFVRMTYASPFLRQWLDHHDRRDDPDAPVFCSSRPPYNRLSRGGLHIALHDAAAGIKKRVHPHIYRHTRATEMARAGKQEAVMRESFGWEPLSDMPGIYTHLSPDDVDRERLAMDGIVKEEDKPVNPNIP